MRRDYAGKTVVVTGAAGGLGEALCRRFANAGAKIAALDRNGPAVVAVARSIAAEGHGALGIACDVTDMDACRAAMNQVADRFGGIDVLVNNAGISHFSYVEDTEVAVIRSVMEVNFFGAVHCTKAALPSMLARKGQVIVISSIAGFSPLLERAGYSASKHALHGFFDSLRAEVGDAGVDVTVVCPAFIATDIEAHALGGDGASANVSRKTVGREMTPGEMAMLIFDGCAAGRRLVLPTPLAKVSWWLSRLAPQTFAWLMKRRVARPAEIHQKL